MKMDYRPTHNCGELRKTDIDKMITVSGWVDRRRDHGGLIFIDLRDRFGITQLVINPEVLTEAPKIRSEWVITAKGRVIPRAEGMANPKLPTGEIEIDVVEMEILSKAQTPPFSICDENIETNEELRLRYRYLDLRRGKISENLIKRHRVMMETRNYLDKHGFLEVTTPILGKSTPEGARDYLVPSRVFPGSFYALPQSPQLFKQLLMISGMHRYFQIAQCFRDEDLRAERQPEFTQVDIEMSFGKPDDLMAIIEGLIKSIFESINGSKVQLPLPRMSYNDAINRYGTDKPDTRFEMELVDLSEIAAKSDFSVFKEQLNNEGIVKGIKVPGGQDLSRKNIDDYTKFVGNFGVKGLAWMKMQEGALASNIVKFFNEELQKEIIEKMKLQDGDLLFIIADVPSKTHQSLDHLRRKLAEDRNMIDPNQNNFLWVTDFPLFEWDEEERRFNSMHHPFTSPHSDDIDLMTKDPAKVRSSGYDLVLNGYEIGGGSQRIHDMDLQKKVFDALKISEEEQKEKFGFFLNALSYGTPPHLGIALGLDRIMMILCKTNNIRDVIAFPKTQKASDLMLGCPSEVADKQLVELGIDLAE